MISLPSKLTSFHSEHFEEKPLKEPLIIETSMCIISIKITVHSCYFIVANKKGTIFILTFIYDIGLYADNCL